MISPDGEQLAFSATNADGVTKVWVRPLNSSWAAPVPGTEDGSLSFWSPDSRSLGFYADGKLKTVDVTGNSLQVLADADPKGVGAWGLSGIILFKPAGRNVICKIPASGSTPAAATRLAKDETNHLDVVLLPDGKHFLHGATTTTGASRIDMGSLDSTESKLVLDDAWPQGYAAGFLLFAKPGEAFAQPLDPATGDLSGKATPLAQAWNVSARNDSMLAYQAASSTAHLAWFDRSGNPLGALGEVAEYNSPKISPDKKQVLARVKNLQTGTDELWAFPISGGVSTRLTFESGRKIWSVWSPDGKYVAYASAAGDQRAIFRRAADGSGQAEALFVPGPKLSTDNLAVVDGLRTAAIFPTTPTTERRDMRRVGFCL